MDRSLRRDGQFLVAVGAFLGALVGVVLGLAVGNVQTSTGVAAPDPARATVSAVATPSSQPTADQPARSGDLADGDASTGRQRQLAYRPEQGHGKAHKDSRATRDGDWKRKGSGGGGKPGNGRDNAGKDDDE